MKTFHAYVLRHQSNGWLWKASCFAGIPTRAMSGVTVRFKPVYKSLMRLY